MKKTLSLLVAVLTLSASSVFALGADAYPAGIGSSQDAWRYDFTFYGRVIMSTGMGLDKNQLAKDKAGLGGSIRIRPGFTATNGNFVFGINLGTDVYLGAANDSPGGSNHYGYRLGAKPTNLLQLRGLYLGYLWDSGVYTTWGVQDLTIPYFNADPATSVVLGWKNKSYDVSVFYTQLIQGDVFNIRDNGELFGAKADISAADGLKITPFVMGLAQGINMDRDTGSTGTPTDNPGADSYQYSDGSKFIGNVGMYAGLAINYQSAFGLFVDIKALYLFGDNDPVANGNRLDQTRNAFGGMLAVGYALEEIVKAEIFVDFRSGSKKDANDITGGGTNYSFNGGIIEYDASTPPLLILYNYGDGREGYQYTGAFRDGYAFTDRGAVTLGADATFTVAMFDIGISLGYAWYAATYHDSNIGFEADIMASYNMMKGASLYLQAGVLAPGKGVKQEAEHQVGGGIRAQVPWMLNFGMRYSL